jgi:UDP-glucose 4-epimerase
VNHRHPGIEQIVRLLLTGASSLTGAWMAAACHAAGIEVHAALREEPERYTGMRARRVAMLGTSARLHSGITAGSGALATLIDTVEPDVVAYHAHPMDGFRTAEYDYLGAAAVMTGGLDTEMRALAGCGAAVVYTGTVYEPGPVAGPGRRPAVSRYGISKRIVFESLRLAGAQATVPVHAFVVPNPFGPLEEGRFGNSLAAQWARSEIPVVRTPNYIRDNIPVAELAERFARFIGAGPDRAAVLEPSGYVESQGSFATRLAREVGERLGRTLPIDTLRDAPHPEPLVVTGDGMPSASLLENEHRYWDDYASFLDELMGQAR